MPRLNWSGPAFRDLRDIDRHLTEYDPRAALRTMEAIRDATTLLESFPAAGPALDRIARSLRVRRTPYVLIYRVDRTAVTLLRIRHTREDWRQP